MLPTLTITGVIAEDIKVTTAIVARMNSDHENAEQVGIGELEAAVLSLVKALGRGSVSDILERAKDGLFNRSARTRGGEGAVHNR